MSDWLNLVEVTILASGTATPATPLVDQAHYPHVYFRATKSENKAKLKEKLNQAHLWAYITIFYNLHAYIHAINVLYHDGSMRLGFSFNLVLSSLLVLGNKNQNN